MDLLVVSTTNTVAQVRLTARSALDVGLPVQVLDLDGAYRAVGAETVLAPAEAGLPDRELHADVLRHPLAVVRALAAQRFVAHRAACGEDATVLVAAPGVLFVGDPAPLAVAATRSGLALVTRPSPPGDDGRRPDFADLRDGGALETALTAVRTTRSDVLSIWAGVLRELGPDPDSVPGHAWLAPAATLPHAAVSEPSVLVSPWSLRAGHVLATTEDGHLTLDGSPVVAVDLTGLDPARPWLLEGNASGDPRARLSDHPVLAARVAAAADLLARDLERSWAPARDLTRTSTGARLDPALRALYRGRGPTAELPDPLAPEGREGLLDWLSAPSASGTPGRYLLAVRDLRADLRTAFPWVPGRDEEAFVRWSAEHAATEGSDPDLVAECVRRWEVPPAPPATFAPGVNVVGFLRGELGIGESARLLLGALAAADVPHAPVPVETQLSSRQRALAPRGAARRDPLGTTVLCVNSDLTPSVAAALPVAFDRTYRIGMWYWEVEEFPDDQRGGLTVVDEVWVATDFVRDAIAPHTTLPVLTLTPPLPQRPAGVHASRSDLGLPDAPIFLFTFDYLSTAERKNPLGVVDAFCAAFGPHDGPVLVLKSINAHQRPVEAERVRLRVAGLPHVRLMEDYLDAADRDALMAACDCYVSLHRSEGLGLTIAEAMAWGKPVIATGYSGNLQFMSEANSYLVGWEPTAIPDDAAPYPAGGTWADPDLTHAARLMREVMEHPEDARARGERAAMDIATLHSPAVAGRRFAARLAEISASTPEPAAVSPGRRLLDKVRGARG